MKIYIYIYIFKCHLSEFEDSFVLFITQIVAVANLMPADDSVDELDSYMYQTVSLSFLQIFFLLI